MCLMIHCWICVRVDTGLGGIENINVETKHLPLCQNQIAVNVDFFLFFSIWTCCVASDKWTCWPSALRVIEKLDGMQSYPTLRIQTNYMFPCLLNILHRQSFHSLHTNLVFVSTCLRSTITLLFFPSLSCQSPLFCPSITFSYNLLLLSPPSIIS